MFVLHRMELHVRVFLTIIYIRKNNYEIKEDNSLIYSKTTMIKWFILPLAALLYYVFDLDLNMHGNKVYFEHVSHF